MTSLVKPLSVSFVIPCFNSSKALELNIDYLLSHLNEKEISFEVIIVDDGSELIERKMTKKLAQAYGFNYIYISENTGKGEALRRGFDCAKCDVITFTDSDIPYNFDFVLESLSALAENRADLVLGDRSLNRSRYGSKVGLKRAFFSLLYTYATYPLLGKRIDTQVGFKSFKSSIGKKLFGLSRVNRFAIDTEIILIATLLKMNIKKTCVTLRSQDGKSVKVLKDGIYMLKDILRIYYYKLTGVYSQ